MHQVRVRLPISLSLVPEGGEASMHGIGSLVPRQTFFKEVVLCVSYWLFILFGD